MRPTTHELTWYMLRCSNGKCNLAWPAPTNSAAIAAGLDPLKYQDCPACGEEAREIRGPMTHDQADHAAETWNLIHGPALYEE